MVDGSSETVDFPMPFEGFQSPATPRDISTYWHFGIGRSNSWSAAICASGRGRPITSVGDCPSWAALPPTLVVAATYGSPARVRRRAWRARGW
jgi:hypothetical protein